ncbi:MAG: site-specific DNA-methyltransferase [Bacillales bacterium]|jgi:adenine-specific DNA-methyltransferase|nr:site-specific DNA-methyltransferase [Bacillales bacterium]
MNELRQNITNVSNEKLPNDDNIGRRIENQLLDFNIKENNIFVGDNLKVMQDINFYNKYKGKVSFIYIDPPYNTQVNFSYSDRRTSIAWGEFMNERIQASYSFLNDRGCIFISIDDSELANLKTLCDSIFGKENFIGSFITKQSQRSNARLINTIHEYIICYAKDISKVQPFKISRTEIAEDYEMINKLYMEVTNKLNSEGYSSADKLLKELVKKYCYDYGITWLNNYNNLSKDGKIFFAKDLSTPGKPRTVDIPEINLHLEPLKSRGWSSDKRFIELYHNNRLSFKAGRPYLIQYLEESEDNAPSILNFYSRFGTNDLKKLGLDGLFDTPKPVDMIKYFIRLVTKKDDIVMDYFAGSGTTGQAVLEVNEELKMNLKCVLIQLNENVHPNTEVYKKCLELKLQPNVVEILKFRLNTFCQKNKIVNSFKEITFKEINCE